MYFNTRIERLILNNFRNHKYLNLDINKNMVLIYGENGSGKTSVLESISLINSSNGFRASNLSEIVNNDLKDHLKCLSLIFYLKNQII